MTLQPCGWWPIRSGSWLNPPISWSTARARPAREAGALPRPAGRGFSGGFQVQYCETVKIGEFEVEFSFKHPKTASIGHDL